MGLRLAADVDLELFMSKLDEHLTRRDDALKAWFHRPHLNPRRLVANAEPGAAPIVLDLGGPSGGLAWAVQQAAVTPSNSLIPSIVSPSNNYGTVVAPGANATIVGVGQIGSGSNFPAGLYQLTAYAWYGGTADVADNMKLVANGVATIRQLFVPPVVNGTPVAQSMEFNLTTPATFQVQAIAGGGAGSVFKAALDVTPVISAGTLQSVNAGVFVGGIPSTIVNGLDMTAMAAPGLPLPFLYQAGGKALVARQGAHLYVVLQGSGTSANGWIATATVAEVPDTIEALSWL